MSGRFEGFDQWNFRPKYFSAKHFFRQIFFCEKMFFRPQNIFLQ